MITFAAPPNCHLCDEYRYNRCDECNGPICEKHANVRGNLVYCDTCLPWMEQVMGWSAVTIDSSDEAKAA